MILIVKLKVSQLNFSRFSKVSFKHHKSERSFKEPSAESLVYCYAPVVARHQIWEGISVNNENFFYDVLVIIVSIFTFRGLKIISLYLSEPEKTNITR